jgi:SpoVK/Ycf46/Vps4 family AAA+-type ATPase
MTGIKCRLIVWQGAELAQTGSTASMTQAIQAGFQQARQYCSMSSDNFVVLFLDECDALFAHEGVAATWGHCLDHLQSQAMEHSFEQSANSTTLDSGASRLLVVLATNRIDRVPSFLRRPGRIDRELTVPPPRAEERCAVLEKLLNECYRISNQHETVAEAQIQRDELMDLAQECVGYVPADLSALVRKAWQMAWQEHSAMRSVHNSSDTVTVDIRHLRAAMEVVGASALRDAALQAPPSTTWSDIIGDPGSATTRLRQAVEWPRTRAAAFASLGLTAPRGILLYGPPGCAKTTLARAVAGATGVAFVALSPADVYASSYVGEAEAVVRRAFAQARASAPCVLFFDELDAIIGANEGGPTEMGLSRGSSAEARVLSSFLNEMDGVDGSLDDGVLVLGATNRPWTLDAALLRPGRLDKCIFVPPPDADGRKALLQKQCCRWTTDEALDWDDLTRLTDGMTGAEIVGACQAAAMTSFREQMETAVSTVTSFAVRSADLYDSIASTKPLLGDPRVMEEFRAFQTRNGL